MFDLQYLRCAVVGRQFGYYSNELERICYVMLLKIKENGLFERVGIGAVGFTIFL